jgi:hypothetical protein
MVLASWFRSLTGNRTAPARKSRPARGPLCLETLEDRALPSGGPGTSSLLSVGGPASPGGTSGGSGSTSGGPAPAILSTGGTGQIVVVTTTSGGGGGPGGGPGYPLPPTTGPTMTGSGCVTGTDTSVPMPLPGSTVAVVPVLLTTSGSSGSTSGGPATP